MNNELVLTLPLEYSHPKGIARHLNLHLNNSKPTANETESIKHSRFVNCANFLLTMSM